MISKKTLFILSGLAVLLAFALGVYSYLNAQK